MRITKHLIIRGRVQGVGYRESMRQEAKRLGISGWVRNRRDGSVEAMIQGEEAAIKALIAWAWQGPPAAKVSSVDVARGHGDYVDFQKLATE